MKPNELINLKKSTAHKIIMAQRMFRNQLRQPEMQKLLGAIFDRRENDSKFGVYSFNCKEWYPTKIKNETLLSRLLKNNIKIEHFRSFVENATINTLYKSLKIDCNYNVLISAELCRRKQIHTFYLNHGDLNILRRDDLNGVNKELLMLDNLNLLCISNIKKFCEFFNDVKTPDKSIILASIIKESVITKPLALLEELSNSMKYLNENEITKIVESLFSSIPSIAVYKDTTCYTKSEVEDISNIITIIACDLYSKLPYNNQKSVINELDKKNYITLNPELHERICKSLFPQNKIDTQLTGLNTLFDINNPFLQDSIALEL